MAKLLVKYPNGWKIRQECSEVERGVMEKRFPLRDLEMAQSYEDETRSEVYRGGIVCF